jgi:hypothetical protein
LARRHAERLRRVPTGRVTPGRSAPGRTCHSIRSQPQPAPPLRPSGHRTKPVASHDPSRHRRRPESAATHRARPTRVGQITTGDHREFSVRAAPARASRRSTAAPTTSGPHSCPRSVHRYRRPFAAPGTITSGFPSGISRGAPHTLGRSPPIRRWRHPHTPRTPSETHLPMASINARRQPETVLTSGGLPETVCPAWYHGSRCDGM